MFTTFFPALAERNVRFYLVGQTLSVLGLWTQTITLNLVRNLAPGAFADGRACFPLRRPLSVFVASLVLAVSFALLYWRKWKADRTIIGTMP
jgi:hypothetical protein